MNAFATRVLFAVILTVCTAFAHAQVAEDGPNHGYWAPGGEPDAALAQAVENASQKAGHPVVLWRLASAEENAADQYANQFATQWPDRTIMVVNIYHLGSTVAIRPAAAAKERFTPATLERIAGEIQTAQRKDRLNLALARLVGEIGAIAAGETPEAWDEGKHPLQALMGGQDVPEDEKLRNAAINVAAGLLVLGLLAWWLRLFLGNPREALIGLFVLLVEGSVSSMSSGGSGGGGGNSGGGMSGGGGGFDGGGATGSW